MGVVGLLKKGPWSFNIVCAYKQVEIHAFKNLHDKIDIDGLIMFQHPQTR